MSGAAGSYDVIEGLARLVNGETNKAAFARRNSSLLNKSFPIGELSRRTYLSLDTQTDDQIQKALAAILNRRQATRIQGSGRWFAKNATFLSGQILKLESIDQVKITQS